MVIGICLEGGCMESPPLRLLERPRLRSPRIYSQWLKTANNQLQYTVEFVEGEEEEVVRCRGCGREVPARANCRSFQ